MAVNECIPQYDPGQDLTFRTAAAVIGRRFLRLVAAKPSTAVSDSTQGGHATVQHADPGVLGGRVVGVAGYDREINKGVKVVRGVGKVVPVESGAAIAVGDVVQTDNQGRAIPLAAGAPVGVAWQAATAAGQFPLIELRQH